MIRGYIFDYGGTLDTAGRHWGKVLWGGYMRHGVPVDGQAFREAYVFAERRLGSCPIIRPDDTFQTTLDKKLALELEYLSSGQRHCISEKDAVKFRKDILSDIYEGVKRTTARSREVLKAVKARCPIALVSNFYGNLGTVLGEFGLDGLFDKVIESAAVGVRKPDPAIFRLGVSALGLAPDETVVVGDSYGNDIVPAKQAGCHAVWLKGEGWDERQCDESLPDAVITELGQVLNVEWP